MLATLEINMLLCCRLERSMSLELFFVFHKLDVVGH